MMKTIDFDKFETEVNSLISEQHELSEQIDCMTSYHCGVEKGLSVALSRLEDCVVSGSSEDDLK